MIRIASAGLCPRCGSITHRTRTPLWLKPLRLLFRETVTRRCNNVTGCRWRGLARRSQERAGVARTAT